LRLVYYSLVVSPNGEPERQWIRSLRSLRRHSGAISVLLFVYGRETPAAVRDEAARGDARVVELGDYRDHLRSLSPHWQTLAFFPTFARVLSLHHLPTQDVSQLLYLDCDTFFLGDVEALFDRYQACDWYAREEPATGHSRYRTDSAHVDEGALDAIVQAQGLRPVIPFNSGVCLLNNGIWRQLDRLRPAFLDLVWRLLVGLHLEAEVRSSAEVPLRTSLAHNMTQLDRSRAVHYPSRNPWIVDQVALWLILGRLRLAQGLLEERDVPLGADFFDAVADGRRWIVAHYFSSLESAFFEAVEEGS